MFTMNDDIWEKPVNKMTGLFVTVKNGRLDQALRTLKKKVNDEGLLKDLERHRFYIPKTQVRRRKEAEAKRRWQKKLKLMNQELYSFND